MIIIVQKTPKYSRLSVNAQIKKFQCLLFDENISFACQDCDISSDIAYSLSGLKFLGTVYWEDSIGKIIMLQWGKQLVVRDLLRELSIFISYLI